MASSHPRLVEQEVHVFLCHAGEQKNTIVSHFKSALERAGFTVFLDVKNMVMGQTADETIYPALANAWAVVTVLSLDFVGKEYPMKELAWALQHRSRMVPVFYGITRRACSKLVDGATRKQLVDELQACIEDPGVLQQFIDNQKRLCAPTNLEVSPHNRSKDKLAARKSSGNLAWLWSLVVMLCSLFAMLRCFLMGTRYTAHVQNGLDPDAQAIVAKLQEHIDDPHALLEWKRNLVRVAVLGNVDPTDPNAPLTDAELVTRVVQEVTAITRPVFLSIPQCPIALDGEQGRVHSCVQLLIEGGKLGLFGEGGIGKTTLANAIFNRLVAQFPRNHASCEVDMDHTNQDLLRCANSILKQLDCPEVHNLHQLHGLLRGRKVMLLLDNLWHADQIRRLVEPLFDGLAAGSIVLCTSRSKNLLCSITHMLCQQVDSLEPSAAKHLFRWHAFGSGDLADSHVPQDIQIWEAQVIALCAGVPLALEVMGSYISQNENKFDKELWRDAKACLERPEDDVMQRIIGKSLDFLDKNKNKAAVDMFYDIACFLRGELKALALPAWEGVYHQSQSARIALCALESLNLCKVDDDGCLTMHDLLCEFGRSLKLAGGQWKNQKWLWDCDQAFDALQKGRVSAEVRTLHLKQRDLKNVATVQGMSDLHFLRIENCSSCWVDSLPQELYWLQCVSLDWARLPSLVLIQELRVLHLRRCCMLQHLPEGISSLGRLQALHVMGCNQLSGPLPPEWSVLAVLHHVSMFRNQLSGPLPPKWSALAALQNMSLSSNQLSGPLPPKWSTLAALHHLSLHSNQLSGPLPPEWSTLAALQHLWLHGNQLSGPLPPEWSALAALHGLSLAGNQLSGPLPPEWSALAALQNMSLSSNQLSGPLPPKWSTLAALHHLSLYSNQLSGPLPPEWSTLAALQHLWLFSNQLSGPLPPEWSALAALHGLSLAGNQLSGPLPPEWSALAELQRLRLDSNQLPGPLPPEWSALAVLQHLSLCDNHLSGPLPPEWSALAALQHLCLDVNQLSGPLPPKWSALAALQHLRLDGNKLSGPLPPEWSALAALQRLLLYSNQLSGPLPPEWSTFAALQRLSMYSNQLFGPLPPKWRALTALQLLSVSSNQLSGPLPPEWSTLVALQQLQLDGNQLSGPLPPEWSALVALQELSLDGNQLSGPLPPEWSALTALQHLRLDSNQLSGPLPPEWSALATLQQLQLSGNQLSGPLPPEWSALTALQELSLDNNQLLGPLPPEWSALAALQQLQLCVNQLSGPLPPKWSALTALQHLSLDNNQLSGPVPPEWSTLAPLQHLSLDFNQLSGPLLHEWSALVALQHLSLSGNQLSGPLPPKWSTLAALQHLSLDVNQLSGPLPPEWSALAALLHLWLDSNQLSGPLPPEWSALVALQHLSLDGNQLSGPLPPKWSALATLQSLLMDGNHLSGPLPLEWSGLAELRKLHLAGNQLSGPLPPEWSSLAALQHLSLAGNQLSGPLPTEWKGSEGFDI